MTPSPTDRSPGAASDRAPSSTDAIRPFLEERHRRLSDELEAFAHRHLATMPAAEDDTAARAAARSLLALLGEAGWFRPAVPEDGAATDLRSCCLARETLAAASPLADAVFALQALGAQPILQAGSPELRARWLPEIAAGRAMAAFAMTEPAAGSDAGGITTTARREGSRYVLDGGKSFISNAGIADVYTVFASTEPAAGGKGLSAFVVAADTPGLEFVGPQILSEPHPLGEIAFRGCRVPEASRLGEEGEGLRIGLATLDRLRATVAAAACGMARRALDEALGHVRGREQFGRPLAAFQLTRQKIARMAIDLDAARLLTYRAAWLADTGAERVTVESAMAKAYATEAAQRIVDDAVQLLGGRGVLAASPVDRLYRSVRALRIYEGTTEIQHLVVAKGILARKAPG